jgi:hypothetical protein
MWNRSNDGWKPDIGEWDQPRPDTETAFDKKARWLRLAAVLVVLTVGGKFYMMHHPELTSEEPRAYGIVISHEYVDCIQNRNNDPRYCEARERQRASKSQSNVSQSK